MVIRQLSFFPKAHIWALSLAATLPLVLGSTAAVAETQTAKQSKPLSNSESLLRGSSSAQRGAPSRRFGGGSRIPQSCAEGPQAMAMIAPADNVTVTTSLQPSLMLWVNQSSDARDLEFVLRDAADEPVYHKVVTLSDEAGLVTLDMSEWDDAPRLTQGDDYYLYMSLICDASDRSKDIVVEGALSPIDYESWLALEPMDPEPTQSLHDLDPLAQAERYVEVGLWHDAMAQLNQLRQEGETVAIRQEAQRQWQALLEADTDLTVIAEATKQVMSPVAIAEAREDFSFE